MQQLMQTRELSSKPTAPCMLLVLSIDGTDRRTDGRTTDSCMDPASHTMRVTSVITTDQSHYAPVFEPMDLGKRPTLSGDLAANCVKCKQDPNAGYSRVATLFTILLTTGASERTHAELSQHDRSSQCV